MVDSNDAAELNSSNTNSDCDVVQLFGNGFSRKFKENYSRLAALRRSHKLSKILQLGLDQNELDEDTNKNSEEENIPPKVNESTALNNEEDEKNHIHEEGEILINEDDTKLPYPSSDPSTTFLVVNNEGDVEVSIVENHVLKNWHFEDKSSLPAKETQKPRERFKCYQCNKTLKTKRSFLHHLRLHKKAGPFTCYVCSKTFNRRKLLDCHLMSHSNNKPFKCELCEKPFSTENNLKNHIQIHTGEFNFVCDICNKAFACNGALKKHEEKRHGLKSCKYCGWVVDKKIDSRIHKLICSKKKIGYGKKSKHKNWKVSDNLQKCEEGSSCEMDEDISTLCDLMEIDVESIPLEQLETIELLPTSDHPESKEEELEKCNLCGRKMYRDILKVHQESCPGLEPYTCSICGNSFKESGDLVIHVYNHRNSV